MPAGDLKELERWLDNDEAKSRPFRALRLQRLLLIFETPVEYVMFMGGSGSHLAYTEMRLAFIHGLYFTTVLLALACIEQELAGSLYARGSDIAARSPLERLLADSMEAGVIDEALFQSIDELRTLRNSYAHFRPPLHPTGMARRALEGEVHMYDLPESDAVKALEVLVAFIDRN